MVEPSRSKVPEALVELTGAGYRFDRDVVLSGIDLALGPGERLVLLGPNGGGKTTLIRLLLGLVPTSEGRVRFASEPAPPRLAYVPQFPTFDRNFPVRVSEMVLQGRLRDRRLGRPFGEDDRAAAEAMLRRLDLERLRGAYLTELSGGELKRALLARALLARPQLLALDEPIASLDEPSRRRLWELVAELPAETAVVLAAHDLAPETFHPTRALLVDRGITGIPIEGLASHPFLCGHGHD